MKTLTILLCCMLSCTIAQPDKKALRRTIESLLDVLKKDSACDPNPCENGGKCTPTDEGFKCRCAATFDGPTCTENCTVAFRQDGSCHREGMLKMPAVSASDCVENEIFCPIKNGDLMCLRGYVCDDYEDCENGEDEQNCSDFKCFDGMVKCWNEKCVFHESNCPAPTQAPEVAAAKLKEVKESGQCEVFADTFTCYTGFDIDRPGIAIRGHNDHFFKGTDVCLLGQCKAKCNAIEGFTTKSIEFKGTGTPCICVCSSATPSDDDVKPNGLIMSVRARYFELCVRDCDGVPGPMP